MEAVASCSGLSSDKRKRDSSPEGYLEQGLSKRKQTWYYVLGSESEQDTDGPESVYSIQEKSTDYAKDTSDTSTKSPPNDDLVQYEVVSFSEDEQAHPFPLDGDSSSLPDDVMKPSFLFEMSDEPDTFVDISSISSSSDTVDRELSRADFWTCIRCKEENNNPMFRYCEKCFKVRKNFFPPRPRGKKLRRKPRKRHNKCRDSLSPAAGSSGLGSSIFRDSLELSSEQTKDLSQNDTVAQRSQSYETDIDLCGTCFTHPKDGGYNHGNIVHIYNCYKCSIKILKQRGKCPICNGRVRQVVRLVTF